jgi:hypothetical protein
MRILLGDPESHQDYDVHNDHLMVCEALGRTTPGME